MTQTLSNQADVDHRDDITFLVTPLVEHVSDMHPYNPLDDIGRTRGNVLIQHGHKFLRREQTADSSERKIDLQCKNNTYKTPTRINHRTCIVTADGPVPPVCNNDMSEQNLSTNQEPK